MSYSSDVKWSQKKSERKRYDNQKKITKPFYVLNNKYVCMFSVANGPSKAYTT